MPPMNTTDSAIKERLEYLRGELRAERISWGELHELQGLAEHIEPGDVELLEAAGVPEHPEDDDSALVLPDGTRHEGRLRHDDDGRPIVDMATCGTCGFTWNDALVTGITPVPSGRCPNEYGHEEEEEHERFTLQVFTANAAFDDELAHELPRILRELADRIEAGETRGRVRDINGSSVGTFKLDSE